METEETQGGGPTEGRMERGWGLTTTAWALIRRDPTMVSIVRIGSDQSRSKAATIASLRAGS
jgi:hypothetical protein